MLKKTRVFVFCYFILAAASFAQTDTLSSVNHQKGKIILGTSCGALTIGSLVYLNQAWYSQYNTGKFHFFNDNKEWLQMDKVGHLFTNYQMSRLMMNAFDRVGYDRKKTLFIGGGIGLAYMTAIECMDGFSKGWGFSWGDEIANVLGASVAISQQASWKEQRIQLKFSFAKSGLAQYNPSLLGKNVYTQILKDYNAQTYWVSTNLSSFIKQKNNFPKWLNIAIGYSAYGMLGGHANNFVVKDPDGNVLKFDRVRRYYLSVDLDWTKIKTKSKLLKSVFSVLSMIKIPAPTLQLSQNRLRFYYLYQ